MKNHITFFIIFLFLVSTYTSYPQSAVRFTHFTSETGAPQSPVNTIYQDQAGFIWFGTTDGLFKYDGYDFIFYQHDRRDSLSLSEDYVRTILQDDKGSYWIGTKSGLNKLVIIKDEKTGETREGFFHFLNNPEDSLSISGNDIRTIFQDSRGNIWVGTSAGLNLLINEDRKNRDSIKFLRYMAVSGEENSLSNGVISSITEDNEGNIYVATMGGGINVINSDKEIYEVLKSDNYSNSGLRSNYIVTLYICSKGKLWIGTYGGGLSVYDFDNKSITNYFNDPSDPESLSDNRVYSITEDENGFYWIGTFGRGICKFDPKTGKFLNFKNDPLIQNSLNNNFVRKVLIDKSQILWAGTNNGIDILDLKPVKFFHLFNEKSFDKIISDNYILSILKDKNEVLWIGTNKGLDKIDRKKGIIKTYSVIHNRPQSEDGFVYSLCEDNKGNIWLGTFGGGIFKFNPKSEQFIQYINDPSDEESIIDNRITRALPFEDDLIVGTVAGICRFNPSTGKSKRYIFSASDSSLFAKKWISAVYKDSEDNLWIGTTTGLFKLESAKGKHHEFFSDNKNINSLTDDRINSIFEDKNGNLWIATDNGLNKLDKKSGEFDSYFIKDGFPGNIINNVTGDSSGQIWITTSRGLSMFNPVTNRFRNYDIDDGLQGYEFNSGACFTAVNNEIFLGGVNGINWFFPSMLKDNPNPPDVAFTSFKKYDKIIFSAIELIKLEKIELSFSDTYFTFEFSAMDFTNPNRNNFEYKLEEFDEDWVFNGNKRFANYTNIAPGEYTFKVRASNNDGIWNDEGISIRLIIHPPFYSTWWAYMIYAIVFLFTLAGIRRYELNKRKKKEDEKLKKEREDSLIKEIQLRAEASEYKAKALESEKEVEKEKIRIRIASDLHDEIGSNLSSIIMLSSLAKNKISSDQKLIKYMDEINTAAKTSSESIREIIWFINPASDLLINLISKMKETTNIMLERIEYEIQTSDFDPDEKINPDIRRNIYLIYKEIMNNIIRHSKATRVKINFKKANSLLIINVEDNGIGFDIKQVKSGNGLRNLKYRAGEIRGELIINSRVGNGTKITLVIQHLLQ